MLGNRFPAPVFKGWVVGGGSAASPISRVTRISKGDLSARPCTIRTLIELGQCISHGSTGDYEIVFGVGVLPVVEVGADEDDGFVVPLYHVRMDCYDKLAGLYLRSLCAVLDIGGHSGF